MRVMKVLTVSMTALLLAGALAATDTEQAAAAPPDVSDLRLYDYQPGATSLRSRVDLLDAELPKQGVQNLLSEANRNGEFANSDDAAMSCEPNVYDGYLRPESIRFCFDGPDTASIGSTTVEWMPQGLTTVADAQDDELWGSKQAILVSWYDKQHAPTKGVRVSFIDNATGAYRHVLLAYPYINSYDNPTYEIVSSPQSGDDSPGSLHAGGIVWYGNYLYVADTSRGFRVFDMRYIMDLKAAEDSDAGNGNTTDDSKVGRRSGVYYGFGYRYVMPQVGWWEPVGTNNDGNATCETTGNAKFSYVGLDRSQTPDVLVSGEYCTNDGAGRVVTWPLNGDTGELASSGGVVRASDAYWLSETNVQGAASYNGKWFLSRSRGPDTNGWLVEATANEDSGSLETTRKRTVGIGVEDLSVWHSSGANSVWTVTEHPGRRAIYSCPFSTSDVYEGWICGPEY